MTKIKINGKWEIDLPESAYQEWKGNMEHHHNTWEMPRLEALENMIKTHYAYDPVVLYIGAYKGDMAALLASWGAKLIIVEATAGFWGDIRKTWELNKLEKPLGMFSGLMSNKTTSEQEQLEDWPERSEDFVEGSTGFSHLAESGGHFPEITMDDLCKRLGVYPDIVTIDIEGSELEALKGGMDLIRVVRPDWMLSVHPEFMFHNHGTYERELHDLLRDNGYKHQWLDYDHEHHWLYTDGAK
jgi:FkbM family methyltransferase